MFFESFFQVQDHHTRLTLAHEQRRDVMSAQNTHHIPTFYHVFGSFHSVISVFIALYLILGFLCISGENDGIWKLCGGLEKKNGEPNPNITTLKSDNIPIFISPTS